MNNKNYKILFVDLDNTLISTITESPFPKGIWDMKLNFKVINALYAIQPKIIAIISNQGGIQKGFVNEEKFLSKIKYIKNCIEDWSNNTIKVYYDYCPSNEENNYYRKPNIGMFIRTLDRIKSKENLKINKEECLMIGDASGLEGQFSDSDKKAANNFKIDYLDVNEFLKIYSKIIKN